MLKKEAEAIKNAMRFFPKREDSFHGGFYHIVSDYKLEDFDSFINSFIDKDDED